MGEAYPSDNELLNLQTDSDTGIEYIPTGTVPYYLHFRKLIHRLLLAARRANDLRVYDAGGLDIGIRAGKFWRGTELVSCAASTGHALADDKDAIYIYLDGDGALVTDAYDGFPDMAATPHVRLAVVTTSGGDITALLDSRTGHNCIIPHGAGGTVLPTESHTTDATLPASRSGSVHSNAAAAGTVTLSLPASPPVGTTFTFAVQASQELRVDPAGATIRDDSGQTAGKYKSAAAIGTTLTLVADANGDWMTIAKHGTWTEQA